MNWEQIKRQWKEVSAKIMVTWGKLSEDDLTAIAGDREALVGFLQKRYGHEKVKAEAIVDQFAYGLNLEHAPQA